VDADVRCHEMSCEHVNTHEMSCEHVTRADNTDMGMDMVQVDVLNVTPTCHMCRQHSYGRGARSHAHGHGCDVNRHGHGTRPQYHVSMSHALTTHIWTWCTYTCTWTWMPYEHVM